jgi:hypothetical protein
MINYHPYNKNMALNIILLVSIIIIMILVPVLLCVFCIPDNKIPPPPESYTTTKTLNPKIPYLLHKTGPHTIESIPAVLSSAMKRSANHLACDIKYYDDDDCVRLIRDNFEPKVLKAYNMLRPTAFKADLFRYCCLYLHGGVYSDIGHTIIKDYQINQDNVDMILVKDKNAGKSCKTQISFMATIPKNNFYKYIIDNIVQDIHDKKYGRNCLDITGPDAFGRCFEKFFNVKSIGNDFKVPTKLTGLDGKIYNFVIPYEQKGSTSLVDRYNNADIFIVTKVPNYGKVVYNDINKRKHYGSLWHNREVYID